MLDCRRVHDAVRGTLRREQLAHTCLDRSCPLSSVGGSAVPGILSGDAGAGGRP